MVAVSFATRKTKDQQVLFELVTKGFLFLTVVNSFQISGFLKGKVIFLNKILCILSL